MIIDHIKQAIVNPSCLCCGSFFVKAHLFCDHCYVKKIETRFDFKKIEVETHGSAFSLFSWIPFESDVLSELVYRLKKGRCAVALNYYSQQAVKALRYEISNTAIDFIVPIPGSAESSIHSFLIAHSASTLLKIPILNVLKKAPGDPGQPEQKMRSRRARTEMTMILHEQITESELAATLKNKRVLVVDDIMTTGSSFNQACGLLKTAESVTLLTLFHRLEKTNTTLVS